LECVHKGKLGVSEVPLCSKTGALKVQLHHHAVFYFNKSRLIIGKQEKLMPSRLMVPPLEAKSCGSVTPNYYEEAARSLF
jgi:hypothetical protein